MRQIKKRLTVVNDGFTKRECAPANKRIDAVINRYVAKMSKNGWVPFVTPSTGNSFAEYEAYVRMVKPTNDKEIKSAMEEAIECGWELNQGVWSW